MRFSFVHTVLSSRFRSKTNKRRFSWVLSFGFGIATLLLLVSAASAQSAPPVGDTIVDSSNPSTNFGSAPNLAVGSGQSSLIQFDLSVLPAGLTASQISKASLRLFVNDVITSGGIDVSPVTSAWSESAVTYNTAPTVGAPVVSNVPVSTTNTFLVIDITSTVQQWITSPAQNFGVEITNAAAQPSTTVLFDSKESTLTSHEPELEIELAQGQAVQGQSAAQLWSAFVPGFSAKYSVSTFTPGSAITVSSIQAHVAVPPSHCRTNAVIEISDGTTAQALTIQGSENDSGTLSLNYAAGVPITLSISTPAQCFGVGWPLLGNVLVQYESH
ncbi:MAG: DNRLRE domain-containing protein [Candidatus Korobacteraceae bacterium]